jgi:hypothetical protein
VKPNADRPEAKDELKTLPMLEPQAKLGSYALVWFLLNDRVKLLAYRVVDPHCSPIVGHKAARSYTAGRRTGLISSMSSETAAMARQSQTGFRRSARFGKV